MPGFKSVNKNQQKTIPINRYIYKLSISDIVYCAFVNRINFKQYPETGWVPFKSGL